MRQNTNRIGIVMSLGHQQGGAELALVHMLANGSKRYEIVCAFLKEGPLVEQARSMGYRTVVRQTKRLRDAGDFAATVLWLRRWFKTENPDAVLSWMSKAHLYVAPAAVRSGVKTLWIQWAITHNFRIDRIITRLPTSRILCCSLASQAAQSKVKPKRQSSVFYPGVAFPSPEPIPMREARAQLGLDQKARIVGMVARLERWKGQHVFVEAAGLVQAACPGTYFFIVGGAHPRDLAYAEEIRTMAAQSGLGDHLILAGQRPSPEVPLWQASADLIVHPVTGDEAFGMAVAEAMGMGKVVVASRSGGPEEIIENGVNGFLVPRGDAVELAATVSRLLQNPAEIERVESSAFLRGRSFSIERFASRIEDLVAETLVQ